MVSCHSKAFRFIKRILPKILRSCSLSHCRGHTSTRFRAQHNQNFKKSVYTLGSTSVVPQITWEPQNEVWQDNTGLSPFCNIPKILQMWISRCFDREVNKTVLDECATQKQQENKQLLSFPYVKGISCKISRMAMCMWTILHWG